MQNHNPIVQKKFDVQIYRRYGAKNFIFLGSKTVFLVAKPWFLGTPVVSNRPSDLFRIMDMKKLVVGGWL
jgi:hypothetical protein